MVIYVLEDPNAPGVIRYVGKTAYPVERRLVQHLSNAAHGGRTHRENWIRKILADGRMPVGRVIAFAATEQEANDLERHHIALFRAMGMPLTNTTDGGDGSLGHHMSEDGKRRVSDTHRGKKRGPCRPDVKVKISVAQKGKPRKRPTEEERARHKAVMCSPEMRIKMSKTHLGTTLTAEHKRKIGLASTGRKCPKSPEHRLRLSEANIGKRRSEETKQKRREASRRPDVQERMKNRRRGRPRGPNKPKVVQLSQVIH